jgi:hypothetical protein
MSNAHARVKHRKVMSKRPLATYYSVEAKSFTFAKYQLARLFKRYHGVKL